MVCHLTTLAFAPSMARGKWLILCRIVGSQCTLADFALLPYNLFYAPRLLPEGVTIEDQFPAVSAWQKRLCERAPVRDAIMEREARINQVGSVALFRGERARMEPVLPVVGGLAGAAAG